MCVVCFICTSTGGEECRLWRALPQHEAWPTGSQRARRVCPREVEFLCICEYLCGRWQPWWDSRGRNSSSLILYQTENYDQLYVGWVKCSEIINEQLWVSFFGASSNILTICVSWKCFHWQIANCAEHTLTGCFVWTASLIFLWTNSSCILQMLQKIFFIWSLLV